MTVDLSDPVKRAARDEWISALERFVRHLERWASDLHWTTDRYQVTLDEEEIGPYDAPALKISLGDRKEINVTPVFSGLKRGAGRVDVEGWPSLHRVRFLHHPDGTWSIITDSNVQLREHWNRESFSNLAKDLTSI